MEEIFICKCDNVEHQLIFRKIDDEVYITIHLVRQSFLQRIKNGIKYIFGYKSKYGDFDEFIFRKEDSDKLQKIINQLKS